MKGLRSYLVAGAIVALGALQQAGFIGVVPEGYEGLALAVAGIAMASLRKITTGPARV